MKRWFVALCLLVPLTMVYAQCDVPEPPAVIGIHTSHCIQVCPGDFLTIVLEGNISGPGGVPVLILEPGCLTLHCETECPAINPPDDFELGGDPFFPDDYYAANDCIQIYFHWVHDAIWSFEIHSNCTGCFCVTFDRQLAVTLLDFLAVSGDGQIELRWTTASETDNDYFEIRRDGALAGQVDATNSVIETHYAWSDTRLENGVTYHYALTAVDQSGGREELGTLTASPAFFAGQVSEYALHQNYPNPFNAQTSIAFDLVERGHVKLTIYDMIGRDVTTLLNRELEPGRHAISLDAGTLPSGMYLYRLEAPGFATQKKMLLMK